MNTQDQRSIKYRIAKCLLLVGKWFDLVLFWTFINLGRRFATAFRWLAIGFDWLNVIVERTMGWFFGVMWQWSKAMLILYVLYRLLSYFVPDLLLTMVLFLLIPTVVVGIMAPKFHRRAASLLDSGNKNHDTQAFRLLTLAVAILGFLFTTGHLDIQGVESGGIEVTLVFGNAVLMWLYGFWTITTLWTYKTAREHWHKSRAWIATAVYVSHGIAILLFLLLGYSFFLMLTVA